MIDELEAVIAAFAQSGKFSLTELIVDDASRDRIVKLRGNPQRFLPSIFDGDWADSGNYPSLGPIRVLRVLEGNDGVHRAVMRQGRALFVYPLI